MRARRLALLVFLIALGVRLLYLRQPADVPFSSHPIVDGARYWSWAERIAAEAFIRALEQDPDDAAARANLEVTLRQAAYAREPHVQARIEAFLRERSGR